MNEILKKGWHLESGEILTIRDNVWRVNTSRGVFALKKTLLKPKNLNFICCAEASLPPRGFLRFAPLIPSGDNLFFQTEENDYYTLHPWLAGEECDFDNEDHLYAAAQTLADFQLRGRNTELQTINSSRCFYFDRAKQISRRCRELEQCYILAKSDPTTVFSALYRTYFPGFYRKALESKAALAASAYPRLAREAKTEGSFIHGDVAARNFIIQGEKAILIDFDYCCCDLPLSDVARFIKRAMKSGEQREKKLTAICKGYQHYRNLTEAEGNVLYALLLFPQKFWRISHRYYYEPKLKEENFYIRKIKNACLELEQEDIWLAELRERLEEQF